MGTLAKNDDLSLSMVVKGKLVFLPLDIISTFEASGQYTVIHFDKNRDSLLMSRPLIFFEKQLEEHGFLRVHHGWLVNVIYIEEVINKMTAVRLATEKIIPLARRRKKEILDKLFTYKCIIR